MNKISYCLLLPPGVAGVLLPGRGGGARARQRAGRLHRVAAHGLRALLQQQEEVCVISWFMSP